MAFILGDGPFCGYIVKVGEFIGTCKARDFSTREVHAFPYMWQISSNNLPFNPRGWAEEDRYLLPIRPGDLDETEETSKELERLS